MFKPAPMRAYNGYDADAVSNAHHTSFDHITEKTDPIRAVQDGSMDINLIVKQAKATGLMPTNIMKPLTEVLIDPPEDLGDALRRIDAAESAFMLLPPEIREKFDNNMAKAQAALAGMSPQEVGVLLNGRKTDTTPTGSARTDQVVTKPQGSEGSQGSGKGPPAGSESGTAGA